MQLPHTNQKVELRILRGPYASSYSTYVEQVDERAILVVLPTVGGRAIPLQAGDTVRLEYAAADHRVAFLTRVLGFVPQVVPLVALALPQANQVQKYQLREYVRLEANLPLLYYVKRTPSGHGRSGLVYRSYTRDISGNGAQLLCPEPHPPGTVLDINLDVAGKSIHVLGEVVRYVEMGGNRKHWLGVKFVEIAEEDRDLIIRWIFEEQRERRRRGLL